MVLGESFRDWQEKGRCSCKNHVASLDRCAVMVVLDLSSFFVTTGPDHAALEPPKGHGYQDLHRQAHTLWPPHNDCGSGLQCKDLPHIAEKLMIKNIVA